VGARAAEWLCARFIVNAGKSNLGPFQRELNMKIFFALLSTLGMLAVTNPDGNTRFYATFPIGNQVSILEIDTGRTWMIHASGVNGKSGDIIDYDNREIHYWKYEDGCLRCGDWRPVEE
jgi:hypothetical protein